MVGGGAFQLMGTISNKLKSKSALLNKDIKLLEMNKIPFQSLDWSLVNKTVHDGETGFAYWQTFQFNNIRVRMVEYSENYIADHWCQKGHIVHCLQGDFVSELENGEKFILKEGMSYIVSDNFIPHRSICKSGVKLLIIDGIF